MLDPELYLLGGFLHVHAAAAAPAESHVGWAACAIRMNFQESGDGIVARHRDTERCAQPVSLCCRATSVNLGRICRTMLPFLFFLSLCQLPRWHHLPEPKKKLVPAPENTGCDTVCMRLAVGLAGGRGLACGMLQEIMLQETSCCRGHLAAQTCMEHSLSHSNTGVSFFCQCKTLQAMQQQHMQDASSLEAWPWGLSRNRQGAGSPH